MPLKITAISDLHGELPSNLPPADVLVVAGDVCPDLYFSPNKDASPGVIKPIGYGQADWIYEKLNPWLIEQSQIFDDIVLTWGNHDYLDLWGVDVAYEILDATGVSVCESPQVVVIKDYTFFVSPYCLSLAGWAYTLPEDRLWEECYKRISIGTDVIVSHGPALDVLDRCMDGRRVGSRALKETIRRVRPSAVVCGHIHESFGRYAMHHMGTSHTTKIYNVAQRDETYEYINRPVTFEIEPRRGFTE